MQEEVENRTLSLVVSGTKFTGRMFKAAISKYMAHRKEKKLQKQRSRDAPVIPHGKQTVKQLVGQNQGISNIEITDPSIKEFEKIARKYGVDYAVKKDRSSSPPKYLIFFKGRDADALTAERADERSTNSMNITYTQNGDYLIPNIIIRKTKPLGHYGRLRKAYLEMHRPILFNELVLSDKLFEHCAEIDEAARNRIELIVRSLAEQNGVTEQLKAENQMEWVRQMNACKAQAEEVVKAELIYN